jgi:hypothetical protein
MLKHLKNKLVMAFTSNNTKTSQVDHKPTPATDNQLSVQELAFIINTFKVATFSGEQVEFIYNLITKLQHQYIRAAEQKK